MRAIMRCAVVGDLPRTSGAKCGGNLGATAAFEHGDYVVEWMRLEQRRDGRKRCRRCAGRSREDWAYRSGGKPASRVSFTASLPRASSGRTHAQSCSECVCFPLRRFVTDSATRERGIRSRHIARRKSSGAQTESHGYSTVTGERDRTCGSRNPGMRRTRLQSVQAGSPPKAMASCFSVIPAARSRSLRHAKAPGTCQAMSRGSTVGIGTASDARSAASRASPSTSISM